MLRLVNGGDSNNHWLNVSHPSSADDYKRGDALREQLCGLPRCSCSSSKKGRTAAQITSAISSVGRMNGIGLTSAKISAIATALAGTTTSPPPTTTSGATLYASYCAGCHGALSSSQVGGASASQISSAIHGGVSQMSGLSSLTSAQISAIASDLAGVRSSDSVLGQALPSVGRLSLIFMRVWV